MYLVEEKHFYKIFKSFLPPWYFAHRKNSVQGKKKITVRGFQVAKLEIYVHTSIRKRDSSTLEGEKHGHQWKLFSV